MKQLEQFADFAYALMRIMAGFMFSFHGAQKILGVLKGELAALHCFVFLFIACRGGVAWSLDKKG